jgi:hypothetical protein
MSERRRGRTVAQLLSAGLKECSICNFCWNINGFTRHYNSCKARSESRKRALQALTDKQNSSSSSSTPSYTSLQEIHSNPVVSQHVPRLLEADNLALQEQSLSDDWPGGEDRVDAGGEGIDASEGEP